MSVALLVVGLVAAAAGLSVGVAAAALRRVDLYRLAAHDDRAARSAGPLLDAPGRMLRSANALGTLGFLLVGAGAIPFVAYLPGWLAGSVFLLVVVPLSLVIGYAFPRALGRHDPEAIMERGGTVLRWLAPLLAPVRGVGGTPGPGGGLGRLGPHVRGDEEEDALDRDDLTALAGVLGFTERPVREVMTPRTDVIAVAAAAPLDEVSRTFATAGYSRLPVYADSLDNITGMVYAFDILKTSGSDTLPVRPVTTAPPAKHCAELLFEMQRDRRQIAVVLDEYGGTAGLVTLEDLLEELVGEIFDEYDAGTLGTDGGPELMDATGATRVDEIAVRFDTHLPEEAETIGGLLTRAAGRIPRAGERYLLAGLEFDVLEATPNRLERVVVRRGPVPAVPLDGRGVS